MAAPRSRGTFAATRQREAARSMFVYLIRHAPTGETHRAEFPAVTGADPEEEGISLDDDGIAGARALRSHLPPMASVWSSHAARCIQTARHALREPDLRRPELAEADFGAWAGRVMSDVNDEDRQAVARWMTDPRSGPPGGEPFGDVQARAAHMLGLAAQVGSGPVAMVTHGGFIRAALTAISGAPASAAWAFGVAAPSVTVLEGDDTGRHWQIQAMGWQPSLPHPPGDGGTSAHPQDGAHG